MCLLGRKPGPVNPGFWRHRAPRSRGRGPLRFPRIPDACARKRIWVNLPMIYASLLDRNLGSRVLTGRATKCVFGARVPWFLMPPSTILERRRTRVTPTFPDSCVRGGIWNPTHEFCALHYSKLSAQGCDTCHRGREAAARYAGRRCPQSSRRRGPETHYDSPRPEFLRPRRAHVSPPKISASSRTRNIEPRVRGARLRRAPPAPRRGAFAHRVLTPPLATRAGLGAAYGSLGP